MKIVSSQQMKDLESKAYRDGSSESDFMEEAGSGVALIVHDLAETDELSRQIILLCGKGNNAADAYIAGIQLMHLEYEVTAYQLFPHLECNRFCQENKYLFMNEGGRINEISDIEEIKFPDFGIIVDGIFGTGFRGKIDSFIASVIQKANDSRLPIIAVDIPSGLNGETGEVEKVAIVAKTTAFLGLPKKGFFLLDGWNHVGSLTYIDFGLPKQYIEEIETDFIMLSPDILRPLMPPLKRNRHKYQAGQVIGLAGSSLMPGAAILSSLAALCGGAGIVRLLHPEGIEQEISFSPYELIKVPYDINDPKSASEIIELMNKASSTFLGPGLTLADEVRKLLIHVIPKLNVPCVIDADGLTIISENDIKLPEHTVLTPHLGEMKRLLHIESAQITLEFLNICRNYATENRITLVLKGGPTFIFHPGEPIMVNPRGDPGMATAGSGDVLTGLIASLIAQGLSTYHAACLGVYLHSVAGEWAAANLTSYCMTATDIITYFPDAFQPNHWTY